MRFGVWRKRIRTIVVNIALCLSAASALHAQTAPDANDVLARVRLRIVAAMRRLPKYMCVETIDRDYFARATSTKTSAPSCDEAVAGKGKRDVSLRLNATDRVRLDVAEGDAREIYSWPGGSHFESGGLDELIDRGPTASGSFGGYLVDIFGAEGAQFDFAGQRAEGPRLVFTYAYRVPQELSRYKVAHRPRMGDYRLLRNFRHRLGLARSASGYGKHAGVAGGNRSLRRR